MKFTKAPSDAQGIHLKPGSYFIDTTEAKLTPVLAELLSVIPASSIVETVESGGRGPLMISFHFSAPFTIARSNRLFSGTGPFFELPDAMTLVSAHDSLYSVEQRQERGFWSWLQQEHPKVFSAAKTTAETVVETTEAVREEVKANLKIVLWTAGITAALAVIVALVVRSKNANTISDRGRELPSEI